MAVCLAGWIDNWLLQGVRMEGAIAKMATESISPDEKYPQMKIAMDTARVAREINHHNWIYFALCGGAFWVALWDERRRKFAERGAGRDER
jgi:hypothetical protein